MTTVLYAGLIIEIWKVKKAMNVTIDFSKYPYFKMENKDSYSSETLKYDQLAMKYLSVSPALVPPPPPVSQPM